MDLIAFLTSLGAFGMLIAMFLESSILPFPSEIVFVAAGVLAPSLGISHLELAIYGAIGSALGGAVGYAMGAFGARPLLHKWGKYIALTPERLDKTEDFARKHGLMGVLIGRLTPIIPFKVFSIASGIVRLPFAGFLVMTFVGTLPRAYLLLVFGEVVRDHTLEILAAAAVLLALYIAFVKWRNRGKGKRKGKGRKKGWEKIGNKKADSRR